MLTNEVQLTTADGDMPTWIYHPRYEGPSPVVLYLMDAPSIRPALHEMASRLASAGYYVLLPYLYYRGGPFKTFEEIDADLHARSDLMAQITPTNILGDVASLLAYADDDPAAETGRPVGAVGFCMSGGLVISAARAFPERFAAVASIHGAWLVRNTDDSPHRNLDRVTAEVYLGWCDNDDTAPVSDKETWETAAKAAGLHYTLDFFTEAVHGYAPPHGHRYNRDASELHWERVHSMFRRRLR